jgi:hypothetical protein
MVGAALVAAAGCGNSPTNPSGSGGRTSAIQVFSGTVAPGETPSQIFTLPGSSPLHITFGSLTDGAGLPLGTPLTLQFGIVPAIGAGCSPLTSVTAAPALQAQINLSASTGTYCVALVDTTALTTTANYGIRVTYGTPTIIGDPGTIDYPSSVEQGGFTARSFEATASGTVTVFVDAFAPASVPSLGVGVGFQRNDGSGCELSIAATATRGAQFSIPVDIGRYCVKVFDQGTLTGTTTFSLRIAHP